jgi:hypothetical protein
MRWMSRIERQGHTARARPHERQVAVGDGSVAAITRIITDGVPNPKEFRGTMPPMGGAQLSSSEVSALAAYVWALNHRDGR